MNPERKRRYILISVIISGLSVACALALYALANNVDFYFSPTQIHNGEARGHKSIKVGGLVVHGSVNRDPENLKVSFTLTDYGQQVVVVFEGILPDLFREGQGIIALGQLGQYKGQSNVVIASKVLAKHDENYMPPEVAESLKMK